MPGIITTPLPTIPTVRGTVTLTAPLPHFRLATGQGETWPECQSTVSTAYTGQFLGSRVNMPRVLKGKKSYDSAPGESRPGAGRCAPHAPPARPAAAALDLCDSPGHMEVILALRTDPCTGD
ncbi:hypothetical protein Bbelb_266310 [Branchiostoma belcheri]|nr:hypothetical protein Bbelb_266310 [Branchiostoma belcheri]